MSGNHVSVPTGAALRVKALETILEEKGLVDSAALDSVVDMYETKVGPRKRLLENATKAVAELGYGGPEGGNLVAVENTPKVHNLVVCTLCSCYPWPVLGLPPVWYKSFAYRSRAVRDPRGVLKEFGVAIPENVEVRVWDSSAEQRYIVIPQRPAGTERMSEEQLAELVTRDSMVGVALVKARA